MDLYGTMHIIEIYQQPYLYNCQNNFIEKHYQPKDKYQKRREALMYSTAGVVASIITTFVISFIALLFSKLADEEAEWELSWQEYLAAVIVGMISGYLSVYLSGPLFTFAATFVAIVFTNVIFKYTGLEYSEGPEIVEEIIMALVVVFIVVGITKYLSDDEDKNDDEEKEAGLSEIIQVLVVSNIVLNISLLIFGGVWNQFADTNNIRSRVIIDADIFI